MSDESDKPLKLEFSIKLTREISSYDNKSVLSVDFKEMVPKNVDAVLYAKKRIKEEIDRQTAVVASHAPQKIPEPANDPLGF